MDYYFHMVQDMSYRLCLIVSEDVLKELVKQEGKQYAEAII